MTIQSLISQPIFQTLGYLCHLGQLYTLMLRAANKMQMFLPASQTHQTHTGQTCSPLGVGTARNRMAHSIRANMVGLKEDLGVVGDSVP